MEAGGGINRFLTVYPACSTMERGAIMTLVERITEETRTLPVQTQQQVLDFVSFLKQKEQKALEADMDAIVSANLPAWKELAK